MTAEWWIWFKRRHAKEATSVNEVTNLYQANELNQYTNINEGAVEPVYDADGNMTSYGSWQFTWDAENRLVKVAPHYLITGSRIYEYGYDFMSRRVKKTEKRYTMPMSTWTMRTFDYDGWNIIRERVEFDGAVSTNQYVWGLDLSQSLQGAGGVGGLLAMLSPDSCLLTPAYDTNGNITDLVDTNGAVVAHYEYDPYGNIIAQSGDQAGANPFRFSSKYWDGETGFYYYGYRFYSPTLGRWQSRDPMGEQGGINTYQFVNNSSVNTLDAFGLTALPSISINLVGKPLLISSPDGLIAGATPKPKWDMYVSVNKCGAGTANECCRMKFERAELVIDAWYSTLTFDTDRLGNTPQKHEEKHIDIWKNEFLSAFGDINGKLIQTCKPCDKVYKCQEHLIIANAFYQARAELFNLDFDDRAYGLNPDRQKLRKMYSDIVNALVGNYNSTSGDCSL